ncbi:uncharacterized protein LOC115632608 [Scaptodrosophila lebanonensis]|uniref:Uncharacterized protein LOC115632608 n=1 Tax=Drosophila lebanonensis TaxID=7225 RepID=A0A6J2UB04_DROLE|nr:uncharacterized protein LOC115632608 [Scaptodrosophila lebanonensis]
MSGQLHNALLLLVSLTSGLVSAQDFLVFQTTPSTSTSDLSTQTTTARPISSWVLVNNEPVIGNIVPFATARPPTPQFLDCFGRCPTTSEYNPICASNMQMYLNEQKYNCARFCGADIRIVRRGSCEGLFPMQRG